MLNVEKEVARKVIDNSLRFFGIYDINGNILSVHKTKHKASRVNNRNQLLNKTENFVDVVIVN